MNKIRSNTGRVMTGSGRDAQQQDITVELFYISNPDINIYITMSRIMLYC